MTNERQERLIERLLSEAEEAVLAGQWDVVATRCRSALALQPEHPEATSLLEAAIRAGVRVDAGIEARDIPVEGSVSDLVSRADTAMDTDPEAAGDLAERALAIDPDSVEALLLASEARIIARDFDAAAAYLEAARTIAPTNTEVLLMSAEVESQRGDQVRAHSFARVVLRVSPENKEAQAVLNGVPKKDERPSSRQSQRARAERLADMISRHTLSGWVIIDRDDREATAVLALPAKPANHVLHLLITFLTCGLWVFVWLILVLGEQKEQRVRLSIDNFGNATQERVTVQ